MDDVPGRPDQPGIQHRGILEILQASFELYQEHWKKLFAIAAAVVVPIVLIQYFIAHELGARAIGNGQFELVTPIGFWRRVFGAIVIVLLTILLNQALIAAITRAAASESAGISISFEDSYKYGLSRAAPILVVSVLIAAAVLLAALPGIILTDAVVWLGVIVALIAGGWVAIRLLCSIPALVVENKSGSSALARSWELVRGMWWQVFATFAIAQLIASFVSSILQLPFGGNWLLRSIGVMIGSIVTLPFEALVVVLIYVDLRARKESLDLLGLRNELEAGGI